MGKNNTRLLKFINLIITTTYLYLKVHENLNVKYNINDFPNNMQNIYWLKIQKRKTANLLLAMYSKLGQERMRQVSRATAT